MINIDIMKYFYFSQNDEKKVFTFVDADTEGLSDDPSRHQNSNQ